MGATEVTRAQFKAFVAATGHKTSAEVNGEGIVGWEYTPEHEGREVQRPFRQQASFSWQAPGFEQGDEHPVLGVSWDDAQAFCRWLSEKEGVTYRLPTEAEWEYACRGGADTLFSWGDHHRGHHWKHANIGDRALAEVGPSAIVYEWYVSGESDGFAFTSPVAHYQANGFGLHDMHGNVWEWCQDIYAESTYQRSKRVGSLRQNIVDPLYDGERWNSYDGMEWRVIRGGSWALAPEQSRAGARSFLEQRDANCYTGFRVVREVSDAEKAKAKAAWNAAESARKTLLEAGIALEGNGMPEQKVRLKAGQPPKDELTALYHLIPRVTSLEMNGKELSAASIANIAKMQQLEQLKIWHCEDDSTAYEPLAALTKLTSLAIEHKSQLSAAQLREFPWLPNLTFLRFGNKSVTDEQLMLLKGIDFSQLRGLQLALTASDGTGLAAFEGAPLRNLQIDRLSDAGAAQVGRFKDLEALQVHHPEISGAGLAQLAGLDKLVELRLENLKQLTDDDFAPLASMTGLQRIGLEGSGAGDKTAKILTSLQVRDLTIGSPAFTDVGMKDIGSISFISGTLKIGAESKITDLGMSYLYAPKWLHVLDVRVPAGITGKTFQNLSNLTGLRRVAIRSKDLTDEGLRYIGYLPRLNAVHFGGHDGDGCAGVTDAGLMHLAEAPKLNEVKFYREGCSVTDAGIAAFKKVRPNVRMEFWWQ